MNWAQWLIYKPTETWSNNRMRIPLYTPTSFYTSCKVAEIDRARTEEILAAVWEDKIAQHGSVRAAATTQLRRVV